MHMQPTYINVDQEVLIRALRAAEDAKEWASEILRVHNQSLGRPYCNMVKNKLWSDHLENSINLADKSINELKDTLGYARIFP